MRTTLRFMIYAALATFLFGAAAAQGKYSYEGTAVCGMCHKTAKQGEQRVCPQPLCNLQGTCVDRFRLLAYLMAW